LERNKLTGEIPIEFASMTNLVYASLEFNNLNGTVPSNLEQLQSLSSLSMHNNALTGSMPFQLCPSQNSSVQTLTADCEEVACECCTECCVGGCLGSGGTLLRITPPHSVAPTPTPTALSDPLDFVETTEMPSGLPTIQLSATPSGIPSDLPSTIPSSLPSTIPSDLPSNMPSDLPSNMPSSLPSSACVPKIESARACYVTNAVPFSFENCNAQANDWIGMFAVADIIDLAGQAGGVRLTRQTAVAWSRTCGSQFCMQASAEGTVRFGGDRIDRGNYLAYLVRGNAALATTVVRVDWTCF
jgi:hypothetical protein